MSQHDFNIANQSFPATRTDLNNALVALASNSSGDAEPATKYANQFWYETDTNTLKLRNEANDAWISIAVLDQSGNAVQSITTAGLTLGATAISATGAEINQLDAITRGSILYGNASGATARLAKGAAGTVLTSDGTDLSFAAVAAGASDVVWPSDFASATNTYTSSGTWSKGSLADDDYVWIYLVGGGGGGGNDTGNFVSAGTPGAALLLYGKASLFNGGAYVIGAGNAKGTLAATATTFTLSSANNSTLFTTGVNGGVAELQTDVGVFKIVEAKASPITLVDVVVSATQSPTSIFTIPGSFPTIPNAFGSQYSWNSGVGAFTDSGRNSVFGGGSGGGKYESNAVGGGSASLYAANGSNFNAGGTAAVPGASGCGGASTSGAQAGAAGNVRVYHV